MCFCVGALSATAYQGIAQGQYDSRRGRLFAGLSDKLDLSKVQHSRLDEIVDEARHRMMALSRETSPRYWAIKRGTRGQIREILDGEQLATFNAICESSEKRKLARSLAHL